MFDTTKEIEIKIFSGGEKRCVVVFPDDNAWRKRAPRIRIRNESASGERTKASVLGVESTALDMLAAIRKDTDGPEFDGAEAATVIGKLEHVELESPVEILGDRVTVRLAAMKGRRSETARGLVHVLKLPTMRHLTSYRNGCIDVFGVKRGTTETVQTLQAGEAFYDALVEKTEGYANGVPVIHKDFVATSVSAAIREIEEGGDEDPEA